MNITPEQSEQLNREGYCYYIEPMPYRLVEDAKPDIPGNIVIELDEFCDKEIKPKYQPGQKVKVEYYGKYNVSTSHNIIANIESVEQLDCIIKEVEVKRVQDIAFEMWLNFISGETIGEIGVKDYFNKQFSEPRPVKCKDCDGKSFIEHTCSIGKCSTCDGNGVESYISYMYNDDAPFYLNYFQPDSERVWRQGDRDLKPLQIIVNPWVEIVKLIKMNYERKS